MEAANETIEVVEAANEVKDEIIEVEEVKVELTSTVPNPAPTPAPAAAPAFISFPLPVWKPYQAQVSPSNRAQCHETYCKCNIGKGSLRIGHYQGDNMYISWYHAPCAFRAVENRYLRNPPITIDGINGYDQLSDEHKQLIQSLMDGTYEEPAPISTGRPKRACVAAKEVEKEVDSKKATKNQTEDQQPKKRARKNSS